MQHIAEYYLNLYMPKRIHSKITKTIDLEIKQIETTKNYNIGN